MVTGEMGQWVKPSLCKHEDLSLYPQHKLKNLELYCYGEQREVGPPGTSG